MIVVYKDKDKESVTVSVCDICGNPKIPIEKQLVKYCSADTKYFCSKCLGKK